jgi:hypothetical protein
MPIWELTPIDTPSEHWQLSRYRGKAIIRAASREDARDIATSEFSVATSPVHHGTTRLNPWRDPQLVSCQRDERSQYPEEGDDGVLSPHPEDY